MKQLYSIPLIGTTQRQRQGSLNDVPKEKLAYMGVKLYLVGALVWDYTETVLDIAAQMRISSCRKLSRTIRELRNLRKYPRNECARITNTRTAISQEA